MTYLILIGSPGTETRLVGRLLAARLGRPFRESDAEIEQIAGKPIPRIFAEDGERAFRALESRVLANLLQQESSVLALGGDTLTSPENAELVKRTGTVICLTATPAFFDQYISMQANQQPFVKVTDSVAKIREVRDIRESSSARADVQIDTTGLLPEAVVERVLDWLDRVHVDLGDRSYDIHIDEGCHAMAGPFLAQLADPVSSVVIISSRGIDRHYGDGLRLSLERAKLPYHTLLVPAGERYKSLDTASRLYGDLIQRKVDRKSVIIALGGGVIGDLAGFVAATYQRGIRYMQVPTTLLAQVDSSVGGKVGVNHALGKNMIGAFLQPVTVLIDPHALSTLTRRELRSGLAEVVKYGVIWDEDFYAYLEAHVEEILRLDYQTLQTIIRRSCQIKAHVVEEDERESGLRAILNYGHTIAHAVETYTSYERYTHGEAVAIGMVVAARLAHGMGLLRAEPVHRITRLLQRFGLPTHLPKADPGVLMSLMDTDKKAVAGQVRFVLPTTIGKVEVTNAVQRDILRRAMKESIEI
ncbi:MAG TPA: 3-dehydroquinate synthase [Armatimonadota bacterium]